MDSVHLSFQPQFDRDDVELMDTRVLYQGFVKVEALQLRHRLFKDGAWSTPIQREIVKRREAAGVIVYDPDLRRFLLIEQFRAGALDPHYSPWQLEVIAGLIDDNETAEQCLRREALEEAGCQLKDVQQLYQFYPSAGASSELYTLYAATADLSQSGGIFGQADEGEDIRVHVFDYAQAAQLLAQPDAARNAILIMALQWLIAHLV